MWKTFCIAQIIGMAIKTFFPILSVFFFLMFFRWLKVREGRGRGGTAPWNFRRLAAWFSNIKLNLNQSSKNRLKREQNNCYADNAIRVDSSWLIRMYHTSPHNVRHKNYNQTNTMDKNIFVMLFLLNKSTSVSVEKYHELRHQISKWTVCSKIYVHNYALITSIISIHVQERCGIKIRNKVSFHRSEFHFCSSLQLYIFLTKHFAILEPQNPEMDAFYVVQKRHYKDFEALQLRNVRSGLKAEREEEKKAPTYIYITNTSWTYAQAHQHIYLTTGFLAHKLVS